MADWHLNELREAMERSGWRFVAEHPSYNLYVSASWEFERSGGETLIIDFGGIDDLNTLPLSESYGCSVRGDSLRGLYFRRRGSKTSAKRGFWLAELKEFVESLNRAG